MADFFSSLQNNKETLLQVEINSRFSFSQMKMHFSVLQHLNLTAIFIYNN